jgi:glycogen operon protein
VEGETQDPKVDRLRWQQQRNFLATLIVSQGVPMILSGDELGRTQQGNNNAYCQDNSINWLDWTSLGEPQIALRNFVQKLLAIRQRFPVLQSKRYLHLPNGPSDDGIEWLGEDGKAMRDADWHKTSALGYLLTHRSADNEHIVLVVFNPTNKSKRFRLPRETESDWWLIVDTDGQTANNECVLMAQDTQSNMAPQSLQIFASEPFVFNN